MYRKIVFFFTLVYILLADSTLTFYPQFSTNNYSTGSILHTSASGSSSLTSVGLGGKKTYEDWTVFGLFIFTITNNIEHTSSFMNPDLSLEYKSGFKDSDQKWFESSNLLIRRKSEFFTFDFGKFDRHWGNGNRSLILSGNAPSYPQFGSSWQISKKLNFEYFNGFLKSQIPDSSTTLYSNVDQRDVFFPRSVAGHRLSINFFSGLTFQAMEMVIYGGRNLEMHYLLPFIPFWSMQHYLGDIDNVQMCGELSWQFNDKAKLYGSLFIDEWTPEWTFDDTNRNWFGYQVGGVGTDIFIPNDHLQIEYTWTDHRVYRHRFPINDSYSYNYVLGFWAGPHSEETFLLYEFKIKDINLRSSISSVKRGELTKQMLEDQYNTIVFERFSGKTESRNVASIEGTKGIFNNRVFIRLGCDWIDWTNPGFNPYNPRRVSGKDFSKFSLNIGITAKTTFSLD
jgi:hypothetical protein